MKRITSFASKLMDVANVTNLPKTVAEFENVRVRVGGVGGGDVNEIFRNAVFSFVNKMGEQYIENYSPLNLGLYSVLLPDETAQHLNVPVEDHRYDMMWFFAIYVAVVYVSHFVECGSGGCVVGGGGADEKKHVVNEILRVFVLVVVFVLTKNVDGVL